MRGKKKEKYFQWKEPGRKEGKKGKEGKIIKLSILTTGSKSPDGSGRNEKGYR